MYKCLFINHSLRLSSDGFFLFEIDDIYTRRMPKSFITFILSYIIYFLAIDVFARKSFLKTKKNQLSYRYSPFLFGNDLFVKFTDVQ